MEERWISSAGLGNLLNRLEADNDANSATLYFRPGHFQELHSSLRPSTWAGALEELVGLAPQVESSETGAMIFWSESSKLAVLPPFPVEQDGLVEGWDPSHLRNILAREYVVGVVLLRLGRYAVGVFQGRKLLSSKTDTRYVKGRHSAGGQSQKRFERIRDKQVQEIFDKTCSVVRERFTPYEDRIDYIFLGGERFTLLGFLKRCDYLQRLSHKTMGRTLNVREPRQEELVKVIGTIWESRVVRVP